LSIFSILIQFSVHSIWIEIFMSGKTPFAFLLIFFNLLSLILTKCSHEGQNCAIEIFSILTSRHKAAIIFYKKNSR
jgi:hypothetical protein